MNEKDIHFDGEMIQFKKFSMKKLLYGNEGKFLNPRIAVIAKSGSGKSWVIRDILYYLKNIPCGTIIAPTDRKTKFYNDFVPPIFIKHEYNPDTIAKVLSRQDVIIEHKNPDRVAKGKKPIDPRTFLIMDDCMSAKKRWLNDPKMLTIFNEGRHYQLTFILSMQYCLGIQPELRSNFDYIFLLGEDMVKNRRKLYEHYAGMFPNLDLFEQVFMQITDDYGCMVIDNRIRSNDITKKVFWYKAKVRENFTIGCKKFKKYNDKWFDKNHDRRLPFININNIGSKRKHKIHVKKLE